MGGVPVRGEFLTFGAPPIGEAEIREVEETIRSGWIGFRPRCLAFESTLKDYVGSPHAISVGSCSAGLHLALLAAGVSPGDEVITTPMTFVATAHAVLHAGARPVFVDIDPVRRNLDPDRLEDAITTRTRAILPVHMAGRPCDMQAILAIARRHGLVVIDDAAHALGAFTEGTTSERSGT